MLNFNIFSPNPGEDIIAKYIPEAALSPSSFLRSHLRNGDVEDDLSSVLRVLIRPPTMYRL